MNLMMATLVMSVISNLLNSMLEGGEALPSVFTMGITWGWLLLGGHLTCLSAERFQKQLPNR